jgi:hypothetical protein
MLRVADRFIADDLDAALAGLFGERLTIGVVGRMRPGGAVLAERPSRQIEAQTDTDLRREGGEFGGAARPRRRRRLGEEQKTVEERLGDRRLGFFGSIEDARRAAGTAEARAVRIGTIAEGRREEIVELRAFDGDGGLRLLDEVFEQRLLVEAVGEPERRDAMLGFDKPPAAAFIGTGFRAERDGRRDRRWHRSVRRPSGSFRPGCRRGQCSHS